MDSPMKAADDMKGKKKIPLATDTYVHEQLPWLKVSYLPFYIV